MAVDMPLDTLERVGTPRLWMDSVCNALAVVALAWTVTPRPPAMAETRLLLQPLRFRFVIVVFV